MSGWTSRARPGRRRRPLPRPWARARRRARSGRSSIRSRVPVQRARDSFAVRGSNRVDPSMALRPHVPHARTVARRRRRW
jgi:hypothetical protein